ncbi:hypothetical protein [Yinghuangia sp. YIM S09857]|uniref:hypothetical protein n=1 Tax=Yinghuangia sp. YIM S09857 TaxID=3436929 RepID=UPI003F52D2B0
MSDQPKWAWWVVGIVIPVVGIVVSVQLATNSDSDDKAQVTNTAPPPVSSTGGNPAANPPADPPASASASVPAAGGGPAKVFAGPVRITLKEGASNVDLDTASPTPQPSEKGADAWVGFNLPDLAISSTSSGDVMAVASPDGAEPSRDDCNQAIAKRGSHTSGELAQGMRICLQTDEGRTAYLRITSVPTRDGVTFEATVWE